MSSKKSIRISNKQLKHALSNGSVSNMHPHTVQRRAMPLISIVLQQLRDNVIIFDTLQQHLHIIVQMRGSFF